MAVYEVVKNGDPVLREKCKYVPKITPNVKKLLDNMRETMYTNKGVGLAAPQVGVPKRIIVVDVGEGLFEVINPEIMESKGVETEIEGCLSLPRVVGDVSRAASVMVKGLNRDGKEIKINAKGYLARAFQHEIDHLDGILFIDKAENVRKEG